MRLTNTIRDRIIEDVVQTTVGKDKEKIKARYEALAVELYNALYPPKIRELINSLPKGFMPEDKCLRFNLNGMNIKLNAAQPLRVPYIPEGIEDDGYRSRCNRLGNIANERLGNKYLTLHEDNEKCNARSEDVRNKTQALLYSLHTYAQLEKTWPEGKKFYKEYAPKNGESQLPAVLISDLNKTLGL